MKDFFKKARYGDPAAPFFPLVLNVSTLVALKA
jgi:hypothetical protein